MRFQVRHLCLALIPVAVLLAFAVGNDWYRHYCTSCGLIRVREFRTFLGLAWPRATKYRETAFHRTLLSTGHIECSHRWRAFCEHHHNHAHPGEIIIPLVLRDNGPYAYLLDRIAKLENPDKRFAMLTSFDLTAWLDEHFVQDTEQAFSELRSVSGAAREQGWWTKYAHLFIGRLPPNPALQRTPLRGAAELGR